ncbi:acyltransferase family protein [Spirosoma rhododendri]|uniref:Acyltransferase n=1 Tax=Spirosoma rhododendri TaxID=2728024 RepID=A0A7L5DIL8_9BACT|nr:acyltransferase [Spirosoma rhododendri]QJD77231.1 acyltransferase [Spirosoma rhododendri]
MLPHKSYLPVLDGLRGLAILVVVVSHYGFGRWIPGGFGVTLFFFISGFLITRLLIAEWAKTGRIDLSGFYLRRLLRLYPALLFMAALAIGFSLLAGCGLLTGDLLSTLFYYRNYYMLYGDSPASHLCRHVFDITWSLGIEEHFYLFFPLLFMAAWRRPRVFIGLMVLTIVAVAAWRLYLIATHGLNDLTVYRIYHLTDTRLDAIMFGCLVSVLVSQDRAGYWVRQSTQPIIAAGALLLLLSTFLLRDGTFRESWRYTLQGLSLSVLIPAIVYNPAYTRLAQGLCRPWLVLTGKLSYSLYLFHWLGVCVADQLVGSERLNSTWLLVAVPLGLLLSVLSYQYVEKPTAGLRRRFGSTVDTTVPTADPPIGSQPSVS